jgi:hypothetical protein
MKIPSKQKVIQEIVGHLAELVGVDQSDIRVEENRRDYHHDGIITVGHFTFAVEWKASGQVTQVAAAIEQVQRYAAEIEGIVPLVAVPFMGDTGRKRCAEANVAWLDLSGNARIFAPGLRILVDGKPNQFKRRGRPSSAFAPKSSRITRWLLMHPLEPLTQREIARATNTDEGYTSKIVGKLEQDGLIFKNRSGAIAARNPSLLLDAWREAYDFSKHHIIRGHVAARSGNSLLQQLANSFLKASAKHAVTGLAAAWLLDRFAGFRTTTIYLAEEPSSGLLQAISFREEERGANVWLVIPNDEGIFHGAGEVNSVRCVHPVQVYLDLAAHPERAKEAADRILATRLNWKADD